MLAMKFSQWTTFPWISRRVLIVMAITILLPAGALIWAKFISRDMPRGDALQVAAFVLAEDLKANPLKTGWELKDIHVTEDLRLEMDVNVSFYYQAEFIKSRNGRIRYSYLKLSCPSPELEVFKVLPKESTVWVRLMYDNEVIVAGGCPSSSAGVKVK